VISIKKYSGKCDRCGETTVGVKKTGFGKKGGTKCLTCQRTDNVKVIE
jgi:hypothetical protein|tara:strand:+ start:61 stop:204 length:144 start_codon:yes stop_codon:yes gene_type:complete